MTARTDAELRADVERRIAWNSTIDHRDIAVAVEGGIATLRGTTPTYASKMAAEHAAHCVVGILDVANDITVRPGSLARTDTDIARAIRDALDWDVCVPSDRIRSTVAAGWVTLEGTVDVLRERADAERVVGSLAGVTGVTNRIAIAPTSEVDGHALSDAIAGALTVHAAREAERIQVTVADGTVTLSGRVGSWSEKAAVVGLVSHARGVRAVDDQLAVCP